MQGRGGKTPAAHSTQLMPRPLALIPDLLKNNDRLLLIISILWKSLRNPSKLEPLFSNASLRNFSNWINRLYYIKISRVIIEVLIMIQPEWSALWKLFRVNNYVSYQFMSPVKTGSASIKRSDSFNILSSRRAMGWLQNSTVSATNCAV